jgi:hypothetical protein
MLVSYCREGDLATSEKDSPDSSTHTFVITAMSCVPRIITFAGDSEDSSEGQVPNLVERLSKGCMIDVTDGHVSSPRLFSL